MKRKMKASGVEWIGDVPEGWEVCRTKFYFDIQLGKMLCGQRLSPQYESFPYFCAADVHYDGVRTQGLKQMWFTQKEISQYQVENGDLLVVEGGAGAGGCSVVKDLRETVCIQNSILRLRSLGKCCNSYLCYWLESLGKRGYVELACNKATIPHFTKEKIEAIPMPLPPLPEQRLIAAYLDRECGKIESLKEQLKAQIADLEQYRKSVITEAVTGKDAPGEKKPSGVEWIGDVPAGWEVKRNKYLFSCSKELLGKSSERAQLLSLTTTGIKQRSKDDIYGKIPQSYDTYQVVRKGDLVLCLFDLDCSAVFAGKSEYDGMISPAYKVVHTIGDAGYYGYFFEYVFVDRKYKRYSKNIRYSLTFEDFGCLLSPFPPLPEQRQIAARLDAVCGRIDAAVATCREQLADLERYRKSLIYECVTGKREVA